MNLFSVSLFFFPVLGYIYIFFSSSFKIFTKTEQHQPYEECGPPPPPTAGPVQRTGWDQGRIGQQPPNRQRGHWRQAVKAVATRGRPFLPFPPPIAHVPQTFLPEPIQTSQAAQSKEPFDNKVVTWHHLSVAGCHTLESARLNVPADSVNSFKVKAYFIPT